MFGLTVQLLIVSRCVQFLCFCVCARNASLHEKLFLRSILAEFARTGIEEAVFRSVYKQHVSLCRFDGMTEYFLPMSNSGYHSWLFTA